MDVTEMKDSYTITDSVEEKLPKRRNTEKVAENQTPVAPRKTKKAGKRKIKKKLQEIAETNDTLEKSIAEKNSEINNLKRSVQSLNEVLNSVPIDELRSNSSIASSKLLDLSNRNRQLRAELETTKNNENLQEQHLQKLQADLKACQLKMHEDVEVPKMGAVAPVEELQNRLSAIQQKVFETRNRNTELQTQLKMTQKCLQQEVGENVNLSVVLSPEAGWRGRSQQILQMQQKLQELQARVAAYEQDPSQVPPPPPDSTTTTGDVPVEGLADPSMLPPPDRLTKGVRKTEILNRAKLEALEKEIASLRVEVEEDDTKILALKVRNKTLHDEVIKHKEKGSSLEEQSGSSDLNLASLDEKLNVQKLQYESRVEDLLRDVSELVQQRQLAEMREQEMRSKLDNMIDLLANKEDSIGSLNEVILKLEADLKGVCGDFLYSCRQLRKEDFISILDGLETEKNLLATHKDTLKKRLTKEQGRKEDLKDHLCKQKVRLARMEGKLRDYEKEHEALSERKKRSNRVIEYSRSVSATTANGAMAAIMSQSTLLAPTEAELHQPRKAVTEKNVRRGAKVAKLKSQLELATKKMEMLEQKIVVLAEERDHDSNSFQALMGNATQLTVDKLIQQKSMSNDSGSKSSSNESFETVAKAGGRILSKVDTKEGSKDGSRGDKESGKGSSKGSSKGSKKAGGKDGGKEAGKEGRKEAVKVGFKESEKVSFKESGKAGFKESGRSGFKEIGKEGGKEAREVGFKDPGKDSGKEDIQESGSQRSKATITEGRKTGCSKDDIKVDLQGRCKAGSNAASKST